MDLDAYCEWAWKELRWVRNQLLTENAEAVQRSYAALGEGGMKAFLAEHESDTRALFLTPEAERGSILRRFQPGKERHAFLIAAAYKVRCGAILLDAMADRGLSASYAPSYSSMLVAAGDVLGGLLSDPPELWPFDDLADLLAGSPSD